MKIFFFPISCLLLFSVHQAFAFVLGMKNVISPTAHSVRKDTIPTLKMRLEQESERERELKQTVANLSREIQELRSKLTPANNTKMIYKETAGSKLALKLGEMEAAMEEENAQEKSTIPHMRKMTRVNDISKKQYVIEKNSMKRREKKLPLIGEKDNSKPELHTGPTVVSHMPDLEGGMSTQEDNASKSDDGLKFNEGISVLHSLNSHILP